MIRPSELTRLAQFERIKFYGLKPLKPFRYVQKLRDGAYGEIDVVIENWEQFKFDNGCYDYSKAIASLCCRSVSATDISIILDKTCKVKYFASENDETLWVCLEEK